MFCNNKSCLQLNFYGISIFLSFKIIIFSCSQRSKLLTSLNTSSLTSLSVNFALRFTHLRLHSSHFMFYQYLETSGGMQNGYTYWSLPQSRKVEMGMWKWQHRNAEIHAGAFSAFSTSAFLRLTYNIQRSAKQINYEVYLIHFML